MKVCTKCGIEKSVEDYYRKTSAKDGRKSSCKVCENIQKKKYNDNRVLTEEQVEARKVYSKEYEANGRVRPKDHKAKVKKYMETYSKDYEDNRRVRPDGWREEYREKMNTQYSIKNKYGLSAEDYDKLMAKTDCRCEICNRKEKDVYMLVVDHDHNTGAVRGVLCHTCNTKLGHYENGKRHTWNHFTEDGAEKYLAKEAV